MSGTAEWSAEVSTDGVRGALAGTSAAGRQNSSSYQAGIKRVRTTRAVASPAAVEPGLANTFDFDRST